MQLHGLDLIEGDRALDEARRLCWMKIFAGCDDDEVQARIGASVAAIKVAILLQGLTVFEIADLFVEVRMFLWMQNFARRPDTAFGQKFAAHVERADLPEDRETLN